MVFTQNDTSLINKGFINSKYSLVDTSVNQIEKGNGLTSLETVTNISNIVNIGTIQGEVDVKGANAATGFALITGSANGMYLKSSVEEIINTGIVSGAANLQGGSGSFSGQVVSHGTSNNGANGISTNYNINQIENYGMIRGEVSAKGVSVEGAGSGNTINGVSGTIESGNGIFTSSGIQSRDNKGVILGEIVAIANDATGNDNIQSFVSAGDNGNGATSSLSLVTDKNSGIISGSAELEGGIATTSGTAYTAAFISSTNNGNGITYKTGVPANIVAQMSNSGNISGYGTVTSGTYRLGKEYERANYTESGFVVMAGKTPNIQNSGIIKGSQSAIAASSVANIGVVNNYGILAGREIISDGLELQKNDSNQPTVINKVLTALNPTTYTNFGTTVNLAEDFLSPGVLNSGDRVLKDANGYAVIQEIKVNASGVVQIDGKNVVVLNGLENGSISGTTQTLTGDKDTYINSSNLSLNKNVIINGIGKEKGALNVNTNTTISDSIINGYNTALYLSADKTFKGTNVIFNGGGLKNDVEVIKGDSGSNTAKILGTSVINGDVDLGAGNDTLIIGSSVQVNGNLLGNEGTDSLQLGDTTTPDLSKPLNNHDGNGDGVINQGDYRGLALYNTISDFETINVNGPVTLYESAKIEGNTSIHINAKSSLNLRVDTTKTDSLGRITGHAFYSKGDKNITAEANSKNDNVNEYWQNGSTSNSLKGGTLNVITNGIGVGGVIAMSEVGGNSNSGITTLNPSDESLYVRSDSIIHSASISGGTDQAKSRDIVITVNSDLLTNPPVNPDPPVKTHNCQRYEELNKIYKSLIANGDNINAINATTSLEMLKKYLNYPTECSGEIEKKALENLIKLLNDIYASSPYSFSSGLSNKSMDLYAKTIIDNPFKARDKEWMFYGGLLHESIDLKDKYYGKNYHGFDIRDKTSNVKADNKITGAYALGEYGINSTLSLGVLLGGNKNKSDISNGSNLDGNGFYIGGYFKKDIKDLRILGGIGYQYMNYDAKRVAKNMMQSFSYDNSYNDNGLNIYLDGKYKYSLGDDYYLVPRANLIYNYIKQDGVNEGNSALAMNVDSKDFNMLEGEIGLDIRKEFLNVNGKSSIKAGVAYNRILSRAEDEYLQAKMKGGNKFDLLVPDKVKNRYSVILGYEYESEKGVLFDLKGSYSFNVDESNSIKGNVSSKNSEKSWIIGAGIGYRF